MNTNKKSDVDQKREHTKMEATSSRKEISKKSEPQTKKDMYAFQPKKLQYTDPKPLPEWMINRYDKKDSSNYTTAEKDAKQAEKRERENKLGFQEHRRHRHPHQAARQREYLNYARDLPLDFDPDDPYQRD